MISRRRLLQASALAAASVGVGGRMVRAVPVLAAETRVMRGTAARTGEYLYFPFDVPPGANRVEVSVTKSGGDASTGVGLFDERGPGYQSPGFRGIYGEEFSRFFVAAHEASPAFLPGPISPGTWTVIVPVFTVTVPTAVTVTVTIGLGPEQAPFVMDPEPGVVRPGPGWYRGDLHCHTPHSSDAARQDSLDPRAWATTCREIGLDFVALTDHNVVSQNLRLVRDAADTGVLLIAGEEMTNWFHGHATVSGLETPDAWLDFRQRPVGLSLGPHEERIGAFIAAADAQGAYVAAAHPLLAHLSWQFLAEAQADPTARTHGFEVWTGQFQPQSEAALAAWDAMLRQGIRTWANGGSDLHGVTNQFGLAAGTPTTVVYADELSKAAIVAGLRAGRSFVTRTPKGAELYLSATGPEKQAATMGGTIYGEPTDRAEVELLVRLGPDVPPDTPALRAVLWANGAPVAVIPVNEDEQTIKASLPVGAGGYVRAELRGVPVPNNTTPTAGRLDMEALTNPIFLEVGEPPNRAGDLAGRPAPPALPPPPASGTGRTAVVEAGVLPATGADLHHLWKPASLAAGAAAVAAGLARLGGHRCSH